MHAEYLKLVVANCRQRIADGDCPSVPGHSTGMLEEAVVTLADALAASPAAALAEALREAIKIAGEACREWDAAPSGIMRAGKLLIALSGGCKGYRADIDNIHATLAAWDAAQSGEAR